MDIALKEADNYWNILKDLSDRIKLQLIAKLSSSLVMEKETNSKKGNISKFYGAWKDEDFDMSAEEMVREIKESRHFKDRMEELLS